MILEYRLADLSRLEEERVRSLERELGVILVAYRKRPYPLYEAAADELEPRRRAPAGN